jgi:hypothetical protein
VCATSSDRCFGHFSAGQIVGRPSTFAQFVRGLEWVWQPNDGCHFSPLASATAHGDVLSSAWRTWSEGLEADAGPMLWAGDGLLAEHFVAFQSLTNGAPNSDFHRVPRTRHEPAAPSERSPRG